MDRGLNCFFSKSLVGKGRGLIENLQCSKYIVIFSFLTTKSS